MTNRKDGGAANDPIKMAIERFIKIIQRGYDHNHDEGHVQECIKALRQHQQDGGWRDSRVVALEALVDWRKSGQLMCKITDQVEAEILALSEAIRKSPAPKKENDDAMV